jgi:hypothetical protein
MPPQPPATQDSASVSGYATYQELTVADTKKICTTLADSCPCWKYRP